MLESLMSLRPRHRSAVETFATSYLTMDEILESCLRRYEYLFGRLRPRGMMARVRPRLAEVAPRARRRLRSLRERMS